MCIWIRMALFDGVGESPTATLSPFASNLFYFSVGFTFFSPLEVLEWLLDCSTSVVLNF